MRLLISCAPVLLMCCCCCCALNSESVRVCVFVCSVTEMSGRQTPIERKREAARDKTSLSVVSVGGRRGTRERERDEREKEVRQQIDRLISARETSVLERLSQAD